MLVPKTLRDVVNLAITSHLSADIFASLDELLRLQFDVEEYREVPAIDDDDDDDEIDEGYNDMDSETRLRRKGSTITNTDGDENKTASDLVASLSQTCRMGYSDVAMAAGLILLLTMFFLLPLLFVVLCSLVWQT